MKFRRKKSGYAVIEILLAAAVFVTIGTSIVYLLIDSGYSNLQGRDRVLAANFAQSGLEATRNIRDSGFDKLTIGNHGLALQNGSWAFSGESDIDQSGRFSRQIQISAISADRLLVTSNVNRIAGISRPLNITFSTYLNNWNKTTLLPPSWNTPQIVGIGSTGETTGNRNPFGIFVLGNYAYLVADQPSSTGSEFFIFDISNPQTPTLTGKVLTGKRVYSVFVSGNYAFLTTQAQGSTRPELVVVDISNPATPTIVSRTSFNGNNYAKDIVVVGNYAYITTLNSNSREFIIVNVTDPVHPVTTPVGSLELGSNVNALNINGNYAYLATANDSGEIRIINISNPAVPTLVKTYNNPGLADATEVLFSNDKLFLSTLTNSGTNPNFVILSLNPSDLSIAVIGQTQLAGNINGIALDEAGNQVFTATSLSSQEFVLLDITNQAAPVIKSSLNLIGAAVAINYNGSYAFMAVNDLIQQLFIIGQGQ
ncbi:MAG: hypothetical protein Athens101428_214 [Candidatus Berkelbacteria bacterium Athens1014_28]|uniref:LVIVD repeat protein n=1 Tax=Candidatus Berkelbacteria bacterium Athens1014_28 TaxID=2017145 RepID=A0A554LQ05_9BACT|nr:MAG: hypothetical protein Athens101428_214 [Candidatus Berkelbacteria bacterium Athens1014_28]